MSGKKERHCSVQIQTYRSNFWQATSRMYCKTIIVTNVHLIELVSETVRLKKVLPLWRKIFPLSGRMPNSVAYSWAVWRENLYRTLALSPASRSFALTWTSTLPTGVLSGTCTSYTDCSNSGRLSLASSTAMSTWIDPVRGGSPPSMAYSVNCVTNSRCFR